MNALVSVGNDAVTIKDSYAVDFKTDIEGYDSHLIVNAQFGYFIVAGSLDSKTGIFKVLGVDEPAWYVPDTIETPYHELRGDLDNPEKLNITKCEFKF